MSLPFTPGLTAATARLERLLGEPVELAELVGGGADREGTREVGETGGFAVPREEVEQDDVLRSDRARAAVVTGRRLRAVRDHELLGGRTMLAEHPLDLELDPLAGERLAVEDEHAVAAVGAAQHVDARLLAGLHGATGAPDPLELEARLDATALVEVGLVCLELDPVRAQDVGVAEREGGRGRGALQTELPAGSEPELTVERVRVEPAPDEPVRADVLEREHLQIEAESPHAAGLERADHDAAPAADLGVEEHVGSGQRHLVAKLRRAHRVADDQHVRHRARS